MTLLTKILIIKASAIISYYLGKRIIGVSNVKK